MMILVYWLIGVLFPSHLNPLVWNKYQINGFTQGTTYHITYYASDSSITAYQIDSIFSKIDHSLSIYQENSLISQFNRSKNGIRADQHFINVVKRSKEIYRQTNGLFDITLLPLMEAWGFSTTKTVPTEPSEAALAKIKQCMGSGLLHIKGNQVLKDKPCVRIDVNGIAQGYSVDVVADFLSAHYIPNFLVEVGGEIRVHGKKQPNGKTMAIGIESPSENEFLPHAVQKVIYLKNGGAITTSGNYQKYYEHKGQKISHDMNPVTGYPVLNNLMSVTVYAKDAITADGYDNALMAFSLKNALHFIDKHPEISAYFIYKDHQGAIRDTASVEFYKLMKN